MLFCSFLNFIFDFNKTKLIHNCITTSFSGKTNKKFALFVNILNTICHSLSTHVYKKMRNLFQDVKENWWLVFNNSQKLLSYLFMALNTGVKFSSNINICKRTTRKIWN